MASTKMSDAAALLEAGIETMAADPTSGFQPAPTPANDAERVAKLHSLGIIGSCTSEERYDHITKLMTQIFNMPISVISLIDEELHFSKSAAGMACGPRVPRKQTFCAWALTSEKPEVLVVKDASKEDKFKEHPMVCCDNSLRFYAGAPLVTTDGYRLGTLCVLDSVPHPEFSDGQAATLRNFAEMVVREIERDQLQASVIQSTASGGPVPLAQSQRYSSRLSVEFTELDSGELRRMRAIDALTEAVALVDVGEGWRVLYGNQGYKKFFPDSPSAEEESFTLWDRVDVAGMTGAQLCARYSEVTAAKGTFSISGVTHGTGRSVACRCKPVDEAMDVNALDTLIPSRCKPGTSEMDERRLYLVTMIDDTTPVQPAANSSETQRQSALQSVRSGSGRGMGSRAMPSSKPPFVDVRLGKVLGEGGYGKVYRGLWDGAMVAVKIMLHGPPRGEESSEALEAVLSCNISHPNLVQSFKFAQRPSGKVLEDGEEEWETWIVQEFCGLGNLQQMCDRGEFTDEAGGVKDVAAILSVCREVAGGMAHMHGRSIVHGDLSANNVMLLPRRDAHKGFTAKVGDFGLSQVVTTEAKVSKFGTVTHMPPELLRDGRLSPAADVYSFGVVVWQMVTGKRPFDGLRVPQIIARVLEQGHKFEFPEGTHAGIKELAERCMAREPEDRPAFSEILATIISMQKCERSKRRSKDANERAAASPAPADQSA
ncbi:unnamed protein product [Pedinophyceae sp. YPF-701]|nr:unnamed protein product [Pedinophyceae sp. YPF-701]